jgi:hypothetical protein
MGFIFTNLTIQTASVQTERASRKPNMLKSQAAVKGAFRKGNRLRVGVPKGEYCRNRKRMAQALPDGGGIGASVAGAGRAQSW